MNRAYKPTLYGVRMCIAAQLVDSGVTTAEVARRLHITPIHVTSLRTQQRYKEQEKYDETVRGEYEVQILAKSAMIKALLLALAA